MQEWCPVRILLLMLQVWLDYTNYFFVVLSLCSLYNYMDVASTNSYIITIFLYSLSPLLQEENYRGFALLWFGRGEGEGVGRRYFNLPQPI